MYPENSIKNVKLTPLVNESQLSDSTIYVSRKLKMESIKQTQLASNVDETELPLPLNSSYLRFFSPEKMESISVSQIQSDPM
jgi:hypothetical protein